MSWASSTLPAYQLVRLNRCCWHEDTAWLDLAVLTEPVQNVKRIISEWWREVILSHCQLSSSRWRRGQSKLEFVQGPQRACWWSHWSQPTWSAGYCSPSEPRNETLQSRNFLQLFLHQISVFYKGIKSSSNRKSKLLTSIPFLSLGRCFSFSRSRMDMSLCSWCLANSVGLQS